MTPIPLKLQPLTAEAFAPFGEVMETVHHGPEEINQGHTRKYAELARVDAGDEGGWPAVHIYRSMPVGLPLKIEVLERHPLGSQAFMPLQANRFLIVVAPAGAAPAGSDVRGFFTNGRQGVNYFKGVWHHYQITVGEAADYLVIDRAGPAGNFQEHRLGRSLAIASLPW